MKVRPNKVAPRSMINIRGDNAAYDHISAIFTHASISIKQDHSVLGHGILSEENPICRSRSK